ncbi:MAG: hydroxyethylthiazole kinase [Proteobacteria bacterium]|nr:hydroxyethylthiazole kinase [Pseudomonadota bacterium]
MTDDLSYLRKIQERRPAVHCLTNTVVQNLTANTLLAVGAIPSMSSDISEVSDFVERADALLVNLGTLDAERKIAIEAAIERANSCGHPWILDPVLIDRAPARLAYARELLKLGPAVVRGNAGEIGVLDNDPQALARKCGAVVAVTGETDLVCDGAESRALVGGHSLMSRVTGVGCAGTALIAAFCAMAPKQDQLQAVAEGLEILGTAGERAAKAAPGPGTFSAELLDQIYDISKSS